MDLANRMSYLHLLCLGQVVETYNSHIERMVRLINPMTIMRSQGMIEETGSIHNGRLCEKSYARAVVSYGEGNVGVDIWRRFAPLDQELTLVEPTPAPSLAPVSLQQDCKELGPKPVPALTSTDAMLLSAGSHHGLPRVCATLTLVGASEFSNVPLCDVLHY